MLNGLRSGVMTWAPLSLCSKRETNDEEQESLYRGCGSGGSCIARTVAAHIFGGAFAEARALHGTPPLSQTAKGDGRLRFGGWCAPYHCGLRLSRGFVVRAARLFDGR